MVAPWCDRDRLHYAQHVSRIETIPIKPGSRVPGARCRQAVVDESGSPCSRDKGYIVCAVRGQDVLRLDDYEKYRQVYWSSACMYTP